MNKKIIRLAMLILAFVILMGLTACNKPKEKEYSKKITVEDLSALCNRFNYEFVCDINKRVPRIYIR